LILLDDKVARRVALREKMNVKGTLGIVADAARANLLDFAATVKQLQHTNMHLKQEVIDEVIREHDGTQRQQQN
jgi:predicted nucleic acid-binding protein